MSFKPKNANAPTNSNGNAGGLFPVPKAGSRKARVSLIVDLGEQNRADIWKLNGEVVNEGTDGAECFPQKPCQQVAVFADLVADTVDYGGDIGKAHYRLMLNGSFAGQLKGINFAASPPKDAKGKTIEGKPWGFHPQNMLTKLSLAVGKPEIIESMDISELLNEQFMATVQVTEKDSGKKDKDGNPIIYRNVNFKGASQVALVESDDMDEDGNPIEVAPVFPALKMPAKCITFANATKEDIKYIRGAVLKQIKLANDYIVKKPDGTLVPSQMKIAIDEYEAENGGAAEEKPKAEKPAAAPKAAPKKPVPKEADDMDEDVPF